MRASEFVTEIGVGALWKAAKANTDSRKELQAIDPNWDNLSKDEKRQAIARTSANTVAARGAQQAWSKVKAELLLRDPDMKLFGQGSAMDSFIKRYLDVDYDNYTDREQNEIDAALNDVRNAEAGSQEELNAWKNVASITTGLNAMYSTSLIRGKGRFGGDTDSDKLDKILDRVANLEKEKITLQKQLDNAQQQQLQQTSPQQRAQVQNQQDQVDKAVDTVKAGTTINMKPFGKVKWDGNVWTDSRGSALPDAVQKLASAEVKTQQVKKAMDSAKIASRAYADVFGKARDELNANQ